MRRLLPRRYEPVGLVVAVLACWMSLTPSLLPRDAVFQGVVSGVSAVVGYGVGVAAHRLARFMLERDLVWHPGRRVAVVLVVVALAVTGAVFVYYVRWQDRLRSLMGMDRASLWQPVVIVLLALATFVLLVAAVRLPARGARALARPLTRVVPRRVASVVGGGIVLALVVGLVNGVVAGAFVSLLDDTFEALNEQTEAEREPPEAAERSGSPESLLTWESLGRLGREFVSTGPTVDELSEFSGRPATQPVRAYVGLGSAPSVRQEAALAVEELRRAGAFDRAVICVVTTTGTGWVNENAVDSLEYLYNGDTAVVSMQYSYLPSWMSFVVDQARAREAGRELFNAVWEAWAELPLDARPRLVVNGESLGSFGGEAAFGGLPDLRLRTDGALFVGPPSMNGLWTDLTENRDEGSPRWLPVYEDGETVRFAARPSDLDRPAGPWASPRVVFLQYASDPITWWDPDLLFVRPDWLEEERGYDVLTSTRWFPVVTFLQLTADMAVGHQVPDGHGHSFGAAPVDAWVAILEPPDWTSADTERLRELIAEQSRARREES